MMRRATYCVIIFLGILSFTACTKEYHCECTYNNNVVYNIDLGTQYKDNAQKTCSRFDSTLQGIVWNCNIY
jgi:hypothetical protein